MATDNSEVKQISKSIEDLGYIIVEATQDNEVLTINLWLKGRLQTIRYFNKYKLVRMNNAAIIEEGDRWKFKIKLLGGYDILKTLHKKALSMKKRIVVSGCVWRAHVKDRDNLESAWNKLLIDPLCREPQRIFTDDSMSNITQERIDIQKPAEGPYNGGEGIYMKFNIEE